MHMNEFSQKNKMNYNKLKFEYIYTLLKIIIESKTKKIEYISAAFLRSSQYFDATLELLIALNIIEKNGNVINVNKNFQKLGKRIIKDKGYLRDLLIRQMEKNKNIKSSLIDYFSNFDQLLNHSHAYKPSLKKNLKYLSIRNYLMTLGIVKYDRSKKIYFVKSKYNKIINGITSRRDFTLENLKKKIADNEKIGLLAEKEVLRYEKNRLKHFSDNYESLVKHVSISDASLGFDITSHLASPIDNLIPIKIEVKAVSVDDFRFYWSRSEMEASRIYGKSYYLYLVPCIGENSFDVNNMRIIKNPYDVLLSNDSWNREIESISFSSKKVLDQ